MIDTITYPFAIKHQTLQNNIDIAYMDEGKGKQTFLFIHGLANYSPVWYHQIKTLSPTARCIAIDLPGNGLSAQGDYPYTVFFYAECIKLFCETLKLKNIIVVGHSMGGQVAMMIGLRYPSLINKLALIAPAGIEFFSSMDKLMLQNMMNFGEYFYSDEFHIRQAIGDSFYTKTNEKTKIITDLTQMLSTVDAKNWRAMVLAGINSMLTEQVNSFLNELTVKTTIIFGDKDMLIPNKLLHPGQSIPSLLKYAEALMPAVNSHLISNAGHFVQIEKADEVNNILQKMVE